MPTRLISRQQSAVSGTRFYILGVRVDLVEFHCTSSQLKVSLTIHFVLSDRPSEKACGFSRRRNRDLVSLITTALLHIWPNLRHSGVQPDSLPHCGKPRGSWPVRVAEAGSLNHYNAVL